MHYIQNIRDKKEQSRKTYRQLGIACDVTAAAIKKILTGQCCPLVSSIESICDALGVSIAEMFCTEDEIVLNAKEIKSRMQDIQGNLDWITKKLDLY